MHIDKVKSVVIGSLLTIPMLGYFVWFSVSGVLQDIGKIWLILTITIAVLIAIIIGIFINPHVAYQRNSEICVSGIPFPITYGMPVDDGCIAGYVVFRNLIFNIIYLSLLFTSFGLLCIIVFVESHSFFLIWLTAFIIYIAAKSLLKDVLKIYPLKFNDADTQSSED